MAISVDSAFKEFMCEVVNLDPDITVSARESRDNLLSNINEFAKSEIFFELCDSYNLHFGSFARKTKCRELDDVDLMIGIAANGATYNSSDPWSNIQIYASISNTAQVNCKRDDGSLNSTKVLNEFKRQLEVLREYSRSELHRNGESVVLNLKSKDWSFDIVPCFRTVTESDGRAYYLIPNGKGNWKKTDPQKDREHVTITNQSKDGRVLELIRLCKKWNKVKNAITIPSYLLETIIINFSDSVSELSQWIDLRFMDALKYISSNIISPVYDMKEIQGDINTLSWQDKLTLQMKAQNDYTKSNEAVYVETQEKDQKKSIRIWGEILGGDFPIYG